MVLPVTYLMEDVGDRRQAVALGKFIFTLEQIEFMLNFVESMLADTAADKDEVDEFGNEAFGMLREVFKQVLQHIVEMDMELQATADGTDSVN